MKRFWQEVAVVDGEVRLDGRPLRTPGRSPLAIPYPRLADAVAHEWRSVEGDVDPRGMPLTGLANAAVDRIAPAPGPFAQGLARYGETDLLYYRAEGPAELIERQHAAWAPLLDWARDRYDVHFDLVAGVMHRPQPSATVKRLVEAVCARSPFELAGLSPIVTVTGSLIAGLAVLEGAVNAAAAWHAARVDDDWQAEHWGEDELATRVRDAHRADFDAGVRFLSLL